MSQRGAGNPQEKRDREEKRGSIKGRFCAHPPDDRSVVPADVDVKQYYKKVDRRGGEKETSHEPGSKRNSVDWSVPVGTEKMQSRQQSVPNNNPLQSTNMKGKSEGGGEQSSSIDHMASITAGTQWQSKALKLCTVEQDSVFTQKVQDACNNRALVVAEKPSVAGSIARALLGDGVSMDNGVYKGRCAALPFEEIWVTNVTGRIASVDYAEDLSDWEAVDPQYLFTAPLVRRVTSRSTVLTLTSAAKSCHELICATDADPAGDRIALDVATLCKGSLRAGRISRAKFSGQGKEELQSAFKRLGPLDVLSARAVGAREEADLRVGTAFTRLQTRFLLPRWNFSSFCDENDAQRRVTRPVKFISYGPCQTPTLAQCVAQEDQVRTFLPEQYFQVELEQGISQVDDGAQEVDDEVALDSSDSEEEIVENEEMDDIIQFLQKEYSGLTIEEDQQHGRDTPRPEPKKKQTKTKPIKSHAKTSSNLHASWTGQYSHSKLYAESILNRVQDQRMAKVSVVETEEKTVARPLPLNTVNMLVAVCKACRLPSHNAMSAAETLYLQGYQSYPRTESTDYDKAQSIPSTLSMLRKCLPSAVTAALNGPMRARKGESAGDHPAITPQRAPVGLSGLLLSVYMVIARHFVASVSPDAILSVMNIELNCNSITFASSQTSQIKPGFFLALPHKRPSCVAPITISVDQNIPINNVILLNKHTQPPSYLSETELIQKMAHLGIGTDASIPVHINNILQRGYVERIGSRLIPTILGRVLISCYRSADPELCLPTLRATTERQFHEIALDRADPIKCLEHVLLAYRAKAVLLTIRAHTIDEAMRDHFQPRSQSMSSLDLRMLGKCGQCNSFLIYIERRNNRYLYCKTCELSLPLPRNGNIIELPLKKCPLDNFTLFQVTMPHSHATQYQFCPLCISHQQQDSDIPTACDNCFNINCKYSIYSTAIGPCGNYSKCKGMMILQEQRNIAQCNSCALLVYIHPDASKIGLANKHTQSVPLEELEDIHAIYDVLHSIKENPKEVQIHTPKGALTQDLVKSSKKKKKTLPMDQAIHAVELFVRENPAQFFPLLRQKSSNLWTVQQPLSPWFDKDDVPIEYPHPATCGICNRRLLVVEQAVSNKSDHTWIRGCLYCDLQIAKKSTTIWGNDE